MWHALRKPIPISSAVELVKITVESIIEFGLVLRCILFDDCL